jgi:hypothetical protein
MISDVIIPCYHVVLSSLVIIPCYHLMLSLKIITAFIFIPEKLSHSWYFCFKLNIKVLKVYSAVKNKKLPKFAFKGSILWKKRHGENFFSKSKFQRQKHVFQQLNFLTGFRPLLAKNSGSMTAANNFLSGIVTRRGIEARRGIVASWPPGFDRLYPSVWPLWFDHLPVNLLSCIW